MCDGSHSDPQDPLRRSGGHTIIVDPLGYRGWDALLASHPGRSFFHGTAWARVLHDTYGHRPCYFCRFEGDELAELLPVMEVSSLWTGRRGVSLPFSDFCEPLSRTGGGAPALYEAALAHGREQGWRYLERRGGIPEGTGGTPSLAFYGHVIDLEARVDALFDRLEGAVRRGIRKAEGAGLRVEFGADQSAMCAFYALHCLTRRRHGLPPQPFRFFQNIVRQVLSQGQGFIVLARVADRPIAAAVFFHGGRQAIYKFGASDRAFQQLRPNNLLMWEAIKRCSAGGFSSLHLGRTSLANEGLRRFKMAFGAREEKMNYFKYDFVAQRYVTDVDRATGSWVNGVFRRLPPPLLRLAGRVLYPHLS